MNNQVYQEKMTNAPWGPMTIHSALLVVLPSLLGQLIWKMVTHTSSGLMNCGIGLFAIFLVVELWMLYQTYHYMVKVGLGKKIFWLKLMQSLGFWLLIGVLCYFIQYI